MAEFFLEFIGIALFLAIFIGRSVLQAGKKKKEAESLSKVAPLHFEMNDEEDDIHEFFEKKPVVVSAPPPKKQPPVLAAKPAKAVKREVILPAAKTMPLSVKAPVRLAPARQAEFTLNLNHLSSLKQAVIMAEILGPPKGLQAH